MKSHSGYCFFGKDCVSSGRFWNYCPFTTMHFQTVNFQKKIFIRKYEISQGLQMLYNDPDTTTTTLLVQQSENVIDTLLLVHWISSKMYARLPAAAPAFALSKIITFVTLSLLIENIYFPLFLIFLEHCYFSQLLCARL